MTFEEEERDIDGDQIEESLIQGSEIPRLSLLDELQGPDLEVNLGTSWTLEDAMIEGDDFELECALSPQIMQDELEEKSKEIMQLRDQVSSE